MIARAFVLPDLTREQSYSKCRSRAQHPNSVSFPLDTLEQLRNIERSRQNSGHDAPGEFSGAVHDTQTCHARVFNLTVAKEKEEMSETGGWTIWGKCRERIRQFSVALPSDIEAIAVLKG
jgi:hypothetical protein